MARKLKTYQTSLGFYDLAVAAPSMKAALEAWGAGSNLFHQGVAKESGDPELVAATMSKPGVVLKRPVGSDSPFNEHADLPTQLADNVLKHRPKEKSAKPKAGVPQPITKQLARPHLPSRGSSAGVKASAGRRRPLARGGPNGGSRQLLRRTQRWKRVNESMIRG